MNQAALTHYQRVAKLAIEDKPKPRPEPVPRAEVLAVQLEVVEQALISGLDPVKPADAEAIRQAIKAVYAARGWHDPREVNAQPEGLLAEIRKRKLNPDRTQRLPVDEVAPPLAENSPPENPPSLENSENHSVAPAQNTEAENPPGV